MKVSLAQTRYMLAKDAHETARKRADKAKASLTIQPPTRDEIRAMAAEDPEAAPTFPHPWYAAVDAINEQHQVHELWTALMTAEKDLIAWGRANAQRGLGEDRFGKIAVAFDAPVYSPTLRAKLIDLCIRMEVTA